MLALSLVIAPLAAGLPPAAAVQSAPSAAQVSEEELILFALELDGTTLTEGLTAYGDPADPFLPIGELARLLELDLRLSPAAGRVTGTTGQARESLILDLPSGLARAGGRDVPLGAQDARVSLTDVYLRASVLGRLLPLGAEVDTESLIVRLRPTSPLPVQSRLERMARLRTLGRDIEQSDAVLSIASPYEFFSPPALDVILETGSNTRGVRFSRRFDIRAAGDLAFTGYQAFVGSDERGRPADARILFERRSREGNLLGPLRARRVSGGDVFTPALTLGPRSVAGRGFSFSTAPLEQASIFETIDLRGELPIGFDVELYVNDVLRSGQRAPVQGRYEFLDVPLVRGLNAIRIVSYGPQGERAEQVRVLNVSGGQLPKGEVTLDFGLVEQERPVLTLRPESRAPLGPGAGQLRAVASVAYGLSTGTTLVAGAAIFPTPRGDDRQLATGGLRTSVFGLAAHADAAFDSKGGMAAGLGLAGLVAGVSAVLGHAEYRGGFIDENLLLGDPSRDLRRHSELTADFAIPASGGTRIPLSLRLLRDGFSDGGVNWIASSRASTTVLDTLLSAGLDYQRQTVPAAGAKGAFSTEDQLGGLISASRFVDFKWQLRAVLDFELLPSRDLRALSFTADRAISDRVALRFGIGHSFQPPSSTDLQLGANFRMPFGDIALSADFSLPRNEWSVGVRFAFGLGYDRAARTYRMTQPGLASGGSASFRAFVDANGNGRFDRGEAPVPGLTLEGAERRQVTGAGGGAFLVGLGAAPTGRLQVDTGQVENLYLTPPPRVIEFSPRPGRVMAIDYAMALSGEVLAAVRLRRPGQEAVGLSAVRVRLMKAGGEVRAAVTEYDGSVVFSAVPVGTYTLELDPAQSERLGMRLVRPVEVRVGNASALAPEINLEVEFEAPAATGREE
jgi:hypothetical protein